MLRLRRHQEFGAAHGLESWMKDAKAHQVPSTYRAITALPGKA
jgi:hypothetical protein